MPQAPRPSCASKPLPAAETLRPRGHWRSQVPGHARRALGPSWLSETARPPVAVLPLLIPTGGGLPGQHCPPRGRSISRVNLARPPCPVWIRHRSRCHCEVFFFFFTQLTFESVEAEEKGSPSPQVRGPSSFSLGRRARLRPAGKEGLCLQPAFRLGLQHQLSDLQPAGLHWTLQDSGLAGPEIV